MEEAGPSTSGETPARVGKKRYKSIPHPHALCSITWCQCGVMRENNNIRIIPVAQIRELVKTETV